MLSSMLSIPTTEIGWMSPKMFSVGISKTKFCKFYFCSIIATDKMICNDHLSGVPLLVLANKQDLPDCMGVRDIKPVFQQSGLHIGRRDCLVIPVSALTGEGIDEGIKWLVDSIKQNCIVRPPRIND